MLALRLTLSLLADPDEVDPVSVLLPLARWNPEQCDLHEWIVNRLLADYAELRAETTAGTTLAFELVSARRVLPILDGFDEMAPALRLMAISALNQALADGDQIVLTSRPEEFMQAVNAGGDRTVVNRAAVVEIQPMNFDDYLWRYLTGATGHGVSSRWRPVVRHVHGRPNGALATCLATPLMAWLARTVYSNQSRQPEELVNLGNQVKIESFLLGSIVPAVFADGARPAGGRRRHSYRSADVHRWLTYIAKYLGRADTRDLTWWELRRAIPRCQLEIVVGIVAGLVFGPLFGWAGVHAAGLGLGPVLGLLFGAAFGNAYATLRAGTSRGGVAGGFRGLPNTRTLGRRLGCGLLTVATAWITASLLLGLLQTTGLLDDVAEPGLEPETVVLGLIAGVSLALLAGLVVGAVAGIILRSAERLEAAVATVRAPDPRATLQRDRAATVVVGSMFTVIVGLVTGIAVLLAFAGQLEYGLSGAAGGAVTGGIAAIMMFTAWAPFVPARIWLACRRKLPWRLMTFLDEAHRLEVLRQFGAAYQFRHIRLQHQLEFGQSQPKTPPPIEPQQLS